MLLYCGTKALTTSDYTVATLRSRKADGRTRAVCRNAVDRIYNLTGVKTTLHTIPNNKGVLVKESSRSARPYDDELVLYTPDLWAHWQVPMLLLEQRNGHDTHFMILPAEDRFGYNSAHNDEIKSILQQVARSSSARTMDNVWVVKPNAKKYVEAAYVVMRPDMGWRWFGFFTYGAEGVSDIDMLGVL
jgi:hypothetical protein